MKHKGMMHFRRAKRAGKLVILGSQNHHNPKEIQPFGRLGEVLARNFSVFSVSRFGDRGANRKHFGCESPKSTPRNTSVNRKHFELPECVLESAGWGNTM